MWKNTYQKLYKQAKSITEKKASVKFYNEREQLYSETDASGARWGAGLL